MIIQKKNRVPTLSPSTSLGVWNNILPVFLQFTINLTVIFHYGNFFWSYFTCFAYTIQYGKFNATTWECHFNRGTYTLLIESVPNTQTETHIKSKIMQVFFLFFKGIQESLYTSADSDFPVLVHTPSAWATQPMLNSKWMWVLHEWERCSLRLLSFQLTGWMLLRARGDLGLHNMWQKRLQQ